MNPVGVDSSSLLGCIRQAGRLVCDQATAASSSAALEHLHDAYLVYHRARGGDNLEFSMDWAAVAAASYVAGVRDATVDIPRVVRARLLTGLQDVCKQQREVLQVALRTPEQYENVRRLLAQSARCAAAEGPSDSGEPVLPGEPVLRAALGAALLACLEASPNAALITWEVVTRGPAPRGAPSLARQRQYGRLRGPSLPLEQLLPVLLALAFREQGGVLETAGIALSAATAAVLRCPESLPHSAADTCLATALECLVVARPQARGILDGGGRRAACTKVSACMFIGALAQRLLIRSATPKVTAKIVARLLDGFEGEVSQLRDRKNMAAAAQDRGLSALVASVFLLTLCKLLLHNAATTSTTGNCDHAALPQQQEHKPLAPLAVRLTQLLIGLLTGPEIEVRPLVGSAGQLSPLWLGGGNAAGPSSVRKLQPSPPQLQRLFPPVLDDDSPTRQRGGGHGVAIARGGRSDELVMLLYSTTAHVLVALLASSHPYSEESGPHVAVALPPRSLSPNLSVAAATLCKEVSAALQAVARLLRGSAPAHRIDSLLRPLQAVAARRGGTRTTVAAADAEIGEKGVAAQRVRECVASWDRVARMLGVLNRILEAAGHVPGFGAAVGRKLVESTLSFQRDAVVAWEQRQQQPSTPPVSEAPPPHDTTTQRLLRAVTLASIGCARAAQPREFRELLHALTSHQASADDSTASDSRDRLWKRAVRAHLPAALNTLAQRLRELQGALLTQPSSAAFAALEECRVVVRHRLLHDVLDVGTCLLLHRRADALPCMSAQRFLLPALAEALACPGGAVDPLDDFFVCSRGAPAPARSALMSLRMYRCLWLQLVLALPAECGLSICLGGPGHNRDDSAAPAPALRDQSQLRLLAVHTPVLARPDRDSLGHNPTTPPASSSGHGPDVAATARCDTSPLETNERKVAAFAENLAALFSRAAMAGAASAASVPAAPAAVAQVYWQQLLKGLKASSIVTLRVALTLEVLRAANGTCKGILPYVGDSHWLETEAGTPDAVAVITAAFADVTFAAFLETAQALPPTDAASAHLEDEVVFLVSHIADRREHVGKVASVLLSRLLALKPCVILREGVFSALMSLLGVVRLRAEAAQLHGLVTHGDDSGALPAPTAYPLYLSDSPTTLAAMHSALVSTVSCWLRRAHSSMPAAAAGAVRRYLGGGPRGVGDPATDMHCLQERLRIIACLDASHSDNAATLPGVDYARSLPLTHFGLAAWLGSSPHPALQAAHEAEALASQQRFSEQQSTTTPRAAGGALSSSFSLLGRLGSGQVRSGDAAVFRQRSGSSASSNEERPSHPPSPSSAKGGKPSWRSGSHSSGTAPAATMDAAASKEAPVCFRRLSEACAEELHRRAMYLVTGAEVLRAWSSTTDGDTPLECGRARGVADTEALGGVTVAASSAGVPDGLHARLVARLRDAVRAVKAAASMPPSAPRALDCARQQAVASFDTCMFTIAAVLVQATPLVRQQLQALVVYLVWAPVKLGGKCPAGALRAASRCWAWICDDAPELQPLLANQLLLAWKATAERRDGLFAPSASIIPSSTAESDTATGHTVLASTLIIALEMLQETASASAGEAALRLNVSLLDAARTGLVYRVGDVATCPSFLQWRVRWLTLALKAAGRVTALVEATMSWSSLRRGGGVSNHKGPASFPGDSGGSGGSNASRGVASEPTSSTHNYGSPDVTERAGGRAAALEDTGVPHQTVSPPTSDHHQRSSSFIAHLSSAERIQSQLLRTALQWVARCPPHYDLQRLREEYLALLELCRQLDRLAVRLSAPQQAHTAALLSPLLHCLSGQGGPTDSALLEMDPDGRGDSSQRGGALEAEGEEEEEEYTPWDADHAPTSEEVRNLLLHRAERYVAMTAAMMQCSDVTGSDRPSVPPLPPYLPLPSLETPHPLPSRLADPEVEQVPLPATVSCTSVVVALLVLLGDEIDKMAAWFNPLSRPARMLPWQVEYSLESALGGGSSYSSGSSNPGAQASSVDWRSLVDIVWRVDPRAAVRVWERFRKQPYITLPLQQHVLRDPTAVQAMPEAILLLVTNNSVAVDAPQLRTLANWAPARMPTIIRLLSRCSPDDTAGNAPSAPPFAHPAVASYVGASLHQCSTDEVVQYLPQLVQALRHDQAGQLAGFLFDVGRTSKLIASQLVWQLLAESSLEVVSPSAGGGGGGGISAEDEVRASASQRRVAPRQTLDSSESHGFQHELQGGDPLPSRAAALLGRILSTFSPAARGLLELQLAFWDGVTNISTRLKMECASKDARRAAIGKFLRDLRHDAERDAFYAKSRQVEQVQHELAAAAAAATAGPPPDSHTASVDSAGAAAALRGPTLAVTPGGGGIHDPAAAAAPPSPPGQPRRALPLAGALELLAGRVRAPTTREERSSAAAATATGPDVNALLPAIPGVVLLPTDPSVRVTRIVPNSGRPMQSAAKCPFLLSFEVQPCGGPDAVMAAAEEVEAARLHGLRQAQESGASDGGGSGEGPPGSLRAAVQAIASQQLPSQAVTGQAAMLRAKFAMQHAKSVVRHCIQNRRVQLEQSLSRKPQDQGHSLDYTAPSAGGLGSLSGEREGQGHPPASQRDNGEDLHIPPTVSTGLDAQEVGCLPSVNTSGIITTEAIAAPSSVPRDDTGTKQEQPNDHTEHEAAALPAHAVEASSGSPCISGAAAAATGHAAQLQRGAPSAAAAAVAAPATRSLIFKTFDDCRQDAMVTQVLRLLRRHYDRAGLGLVLKPYAILPTVSGSARAPGGILEVIPNVRSRDEIGKAGFATLLDYFRATFGPPGSRRFLAARTAMAHSLAAYAIPSLLLWIKDRHNGNILVSSEGHLCQIDFGFLLGITPGGNLRFETAAFKLTQEMVDVVGEGSTESDAFLYFGECVCRAYLLAREPEAAEAMEAMVCGLADSNLPCYYFRDTLQAFRARLHGELGDVAAARWMHGETLAAASSRRTMLYDGVQRVQQGVHSADWL